MSKNGESAPLVSSQPIDGQVHPAGAPPAYTAYQQKAGARLDDLSAQKLMAVNSFGLKQGNRLGETLAPGCCANRYMVTDRHRMIQVRGREQDMVETPLWIVQEEGDCLTRICCCGKQPILAKFYHAQMPSVGETACGCCYLGHTFLPDLQQPVVMTLERDGCCNKWIGCYMCGPKCQSEAWLHAGNVDGRPGTLAATNDQSVIGRSQVPMDVCFTPKMDVYNGSASAGESLLGQMSGPCFFGGCLDLCCDTRFELSSTKNASDAAKGDVGAIWKERPKSCFSVCMQCHGDVDEYSVDFQQNQMTPEQKANYIATAVHLDYWFFQQDARPVYVQDNGGNGVVVITLCNCFVRGMVCPCQLCIPYGKK